MTERSEGAGEPVGSLAEEAARLWEALTERVGNDETDAGGAPDGVPGSRDGHPRPGPETGPAADPLLDAAAHSVRGLAEVLYRVNEHVATGDTECRYCPLCRAIHAVRESSPEVRRHLGDAAGSLLSAAAGLLADRGRVDDGADDSGADDGGSGPASA